MQNTLTRRPLVTVEDAFTVDGTDRLLVAHADPACIAAQGHEADPTDTRIPRDCRWCVEGDLDNPLAWMPHLSSIPTDVERDAERRTEYGTGEGKGHTAAEGASAKQLAFIARLATERGVDAPDGPLTKKAASALIERLLALPVAAAPTTTQAVRTNRYAGTCATCHQPVDEGAGRIEKLDGRWVTYHLDGTCPQTAPAAAPVALPDVPQGHYAIASTGTNDLMFVRIDRNERGTFAKLIVGGHPDQNLRRNQVPGILARIVEAGVDASARLYGTEIGRCHVCNRHLTDETSRRLGIGPDCRSRA